MGASDSRVQVVEYGPTTKVQHGGDERDCMTERRPQRKESGMMNRVVLAKERKNRRRCRNISVTYDWGNERLHVRFSKEVKSVEVK